MKRLKYFLLTKTFPRACQFVNAWLNVQRIFKDNGSHLVKILNHEDLVHNKKLFYRELCEAINIKTKDSQINKKGFESCFGALKIIKDGWETEAIPRQSINYDEKISFFAKIFKNI